MHPHNLPFLGLELGLEVGHRLEEELGLAFVGLVAHKLVDRTVVEPLSEHTVVELDLMAGHTLVELLVEHTVVEHLVEHTSFELGRLE